MAVPNNYPASHTPPPGSPSSPYGAAQGPEPYSQIVSETGGGWKAFEKWLGPKNYHAFINNICNAINQQIQKDKAASQKAADQLKASIEGRDIYEDN